MILVRVNLTYCKYCNDDRVDRELERPEIEFPDSRIVSSKLSTVSESGIVEN